MSTISAETTKADVHSWSELQKLASDTTVGTALNREVETRKTGRGSPFVQNSLRLFNSEETKPKFTLYRDHAGWCPYCQKTMLLIEEKEIPINIELVPMRSYGDKPREFLQKVPSGLLPALLVERDDGQQQVITESQVIMELLDRWHPSEEGYKPMLPDESDTEGWAKYDQLARLERELFSWWCTLIFRPEMPSSPGGLMGMLTGSGGSEMSNAMKSFLDCLTKVDKALTATSGPWFFDDHPYPTMIDFVYVSHLERMLASCAYWKGLDIRGMKEEYPGINAWFDAFEKRECYLAFKSDYYTHVMDIPPQYGPGYDGGFEEQREKFSKMINGRDNSSWKLPLTHDDPLQPLFRGPPLPVSVLESVGIYPDDDGTYQNCDAANMAQTCRQMAGWKLAGNGIKVSRFAARGGSNGSRNQRKNFGAPLADPYADPDDAARPYVDVVLRAVCAAMLHEGNDNEEGLSGMEAALDGLVPEDRVADVAASLTYLRDRVGVPRDLPLASARQLRAHLNYAIDSITQ